MGKDAPVFYTKVFKFKANFNFLYTPANVKFIVILLKSFREFYSSAHENDELMKKKKIESQ